MKIRWRIGQKSYLESNYQINSQDRSKHHQQWVFFFQKLGPIWHWLLLNVSIKNILTSCIFVWCTNWWRLMKPPHLGIFTRVKRVGSISADTSHAALFDPPPPGRCNRTTPPSHRQWRSSSRPPPVAPPLGTMLVCDSTNPSSIHPSFLVTTANPD